MPRPVRAFACEFGCGRKVLTSKKRMAEHEERCRCNPATKSCPTCMFNWYEPADPETGDMGGWYCADGHLPEGKTMMVDCPHWTSTHCAHPKEAQ